VVRVSVYELSKNLVGIPYSRGKEGRMKEIIQMGAYKSRYSGTKTIGGKKFDLVFWSEKKS